MIENTFGKNIVPENDAERLAALHRYRITDTPSEDSFDGIAKLATQIFDVPISLLSLVDAESVFFKANIGMGKAKEANRGKSLCALAILDKEITVFEDALKEPCLMANPNVTGDFGLRFYAGAPLITHDGFLIGTLCIIDQKPREFSASDKLILEGLAKTAMDHIELRRSALDTIDQLQKSNKDLVETRQKVEEALQNLSEFNVEMEATNEQLSLANEELNRSSELTTILNNDLQKSELRLQSFISKAPVAFGILTGPDLIIEVANNMILNIWCKTEKVLGQPITEALPELKDQPYFSLLNQVFISGKTYLGDTALVKLETDGNLQDHYFDFIYEPLKNEKDETVAIIVIANEVTERINKKLALEDLNQQLQIALRAGELGSYNLDLISGKISSSAQCKANYGLRLRDKPTHEMVPRLIDQSANSLEKLNKLVDDLLNIHRVTGGHLELSKEWFTVSELLNVCCDHVRIDGKHDLIVKGDLNAKIYADEHRIDQVVVNFVNNAVKYAPHSKTIELIVEQLADAVKVSVKDYGEGIDPQVQPYIFDRYYRASHKGKGYSGLGLGLYISAEIIRKHGGKIGVESKLGGGSSFWFTIPNEPNYL